MLVSQTVAGLSFEMNNTCRRGLPFLLPARPTMPPGEDKPPREQTLPPSWRVPAARGAKRRVGALSVWQRSSGRRLTQLPA